MLNVVVFSVWMGPTLAKSRVSTWLGLVMVIQRLRNSANVAKHMKIDYVSDRPLLREILRYEAGSS